MMIEVLFSYAFPNGVEGRSPQQVKGGSPDFSPFLGKGAGGWDIKIALYLNLNQVFSEHIFALIPHHYPEKRIHWIIPPKKFSIKYP